MIANTRISNHPAIVDQLEEHRRVYLSQRKTNFSGKNVLGGVVPRLRDGRWDDTSRLSMDYRAKGFDTVGLWAYGVIQGKILAGKTLTQTELIDSDQFASLHKTSLQTDVIVTGTRVDANTIDVEFDTWSSYIVDNYNWDPKKHLTVPNPDHGNSFGVPNPVRPSDQFVTIYHAHAAEVEACGMAASSAYTCTPWTIKPEGASVEY